jgi:hypothetical protein
MRCKICDRALEEPRWNGDHEEYEPCDSCLRVIQDTIDGYKDVPAPAEDDLQTDPSYEGLYPSSYSPHEEIE